ncbi:hypothetical protein YC2023_008096 [Brassica napus]
MVSLSVISQFTSVSESSRMAATLHAKNNGKKVDNLGIIQIVGMKVNKLELMKRPSMKSKKQKELAKRLGH